MAPIKLRNVKSNHNSGVKLIMETKELMAERDSLKLKAKISNLKVHWLDWKRMKNLVNKRVRKEKSSQRENEIKKVSADASAKSVESSKEEGLLG